MLTANDDVAVFWFRRDLRLHDNHGLYQALEQSERVLPIFIFDRNILDPLRDQKDRRVAFIHRHLAGMHGWLARKDSGLWSFYGTPEEGFQALLKQFNVSAVFTNHDYEPYARERDANIAKLLDGKGIPFHSFKDHVIFEKDEILTNQGDPYKVYTPYRKKWVAELSDEHLVSYSIDDVDQHFVTWSAAPLVPLAEMGFKDAGIDYPDKEPDTAIVENYDQTRDIPADEHGTTRLGIHLRFGTVSIREMVRKAKSLNKTWLHELIWREFFIQVLWHFPQVVDTSFRPEYDRIPWRRSKNDYERWCKGKTGYPIVDAGMRELNETGHMHNRVRMIVASFLCKHLLIDWRWGERYFAEKLLDYELASNNGNWQWAAGTGCDAAPYFRVFNPWTQTEKFDKDMTYIKRWVPEVTSTDYPKPMVDHSAARKRALETYKAALDGRIEKVDDDSQIPLFD